MTFYMNKEIPEQWARELAAPLKLRWATQEDIPQLLSLVEECELGRLPNIPNDDLPRIVETADSGILIVTNPAKDELPLALVALGYDGRRGYISYVGCTKAWRGRGIVKTMLGAGESWLKLQGAPKVILFVRKSDKNLVEYYERFGYAVDQSVYLLGKNI
jgi:ribosomal protein S18 acetylase RimI-like enzyme